jgi:hypothetical protein
VTHSVPSFESQLDHLKGGTPCVTMDLEGCHEPEFMHAGFPAVVVRTYVAPSARLRPPPLQRAQGLGHPAAWDDVGGARQSGGKPAHSTQTAL